MCAQNVTHSLISTQQCLTASATVKHRKLQVLLFWFSSNVATIKMSSLVWSDSQIGEEFLWTSKHSLQNEALVHVLNIFGAICLIFCGYCASTLSRSQTESVLLRKWTFMHYFATIRTAETVPLVLIVPMLVLFLFFINHRQKIIPIQDTS